MKRDICLKEISDGRLYDINDTVRAGSNGCKGCSSCCHGMCDTIMLDPLDVFRLSSNLGRSFEELISDKKIELNDKDGIIRVNLCTGEGTNACVFLNGAGRCSIHGFRPGICRIFPLGRYYQNGSFKYFLQTHECIYANRTPVRVGKYIDIPDPEQNSAFVISYHDLTMQLSELIGDLSMQQAKQLNMLLLNTFMVKPYDAKQNFYEQFKKRLTEFKAMLDL